MNELFSNEPNKLFFYCRNRGTLVSPTDLPTAVLVIDDVIKELSVNEEQTGQYSVIIDSDDLTDRYAEVHFTYSLDGYGTITDKQRFEIARRIVSYDEVLTMVQNITYQQYEELERTVRGIIEVYCKQKFNYWYGIRRVRGNDGIIMLPQYIDKLDGITRQIESIDLYKMSFSDDGYHINDNGFAIENDRTLELRKSIHGKLKEAEYGVIGQWGYMSVPTEVQQAAAALITQKLCPDSVYHERYVDGIRNENMNVKFNPKTYANSTGNYDADKLLAPYKINHMGVV